MKLPRHIPILTAFTARVAGRDMARLLQSPTALARALADTQTVVGHDGVLCIFDPLLLQSACIRKQSEMNSSAGDHDIGLTPPEEITQTAPLATLLESIHPLRHHLPDSAMIFATFTGPGLLYSQLQGAFESCGMTGGADSDYVLDVIRDVVRSSLELKADGIALIEQTVPGIPSELRHCHKTVRKLADFYDAGFIVFNLPGAEDQEPETPAHCVFDLALPENGIGPLFGKLGQSAASNTPPLTTACDVPESTTVEGLKTLLQEGRAA
jgi:hypothetical protein